MQIASETPPEMRVLEHRSRSSRHREGPQEMKCRAKSKEGPEDKAEAKTKSKNREQVRPAVKGTRERQGQVTKD